MFTILFDDYDDENKYIILHYDDKSDYAVFLQKNSNDEENSYYELITDEDEKDSIILLSVVDGDGFISITPETDNHPTQNNIFEYGINPFLDFLAKELESAKLTKNISDNLLVIKKCQKTVLYMFNKLKTETDKLNQYFIITGLSASKTFNSVVHNSYEFLSSIETNWKEVFNEELNNNNNDDNLSK